jgi:hypothetical protein
MFAMLSVFKVSVEFYNFLLQVEVTLYVYLISEILYLKLKF